MIDVDELEKDLRMAGLLRHFKSGIATRLNHEEWAALSELTNAAPTLLVLARAGRRLEKWGAELDSKMREELGDVQASLGMASVVIEMRAALAAFREADA